MKAGTRKLLTAALKVAVVAAAVVYVVLSGRLDLGKIREIATSPDWPFAVAGACTLLVIPAVGWLRWWMVVRTQGIPLGILQAFRIQLIGVFFNSFLFGATGGDVIKAYYIATGAGSDRKPQAVISVLLDRVLGTFGLLLVLGFGLPFAWRTITLTQQIVRLAIVAASVYGTCLLLFAFLAIPRFRRRRKRWLEERSAPHRRGAAVFKALNGFDQAIQEAVRHPVATIVCLVVSAGAHFSTACAFYLFGRALGVEKIEFVSFIALTPLALAMNALPVLPAGGLGAGELIASIVFGFAVGAEGWVGGTILFLWRVSLLVPSPLGLAFFLMSRQDVRRAQEAAAADGSDQTAQGESHQDAAATEASQAG
jgi:uncharacterized protein (TIRG00374 family)